MLITTETHPRVCYFLKLIEMDNGGHLIGTVYPGEPKDLDRFTLPDAFDELVAQAAGVQLDIERDRGGGGARIANAFRLGRCNARDGRGYGRRKHRQAINRFEGRARVGKCLFRYDDLI